MKQYKYYFYIFNSKSRRCLQFCKYLDQKEALSTGGPKDICMYWFAGLSSSEWLAQLFRLDAIEYISNEFQLKLKRDLSFIK